MEDDHKKVWAEREERLQFIRANIERGNIRMLLERNFSVEKTARPLRKLGAKTT